MGKPGVVVSLKTYGFIERAETSGDERKIVEATLFWGAAVLRVSHHAPKGPMAARELGVPADLDGSDCELVRVDRAGAPELVLPSGAVVSEGARSSIRFDKRLLLRLELVDAVLRVPRGSAKDGAPLSIFAMSLVGHAAMLAALAWSFHGHGPENTASYDTERLAQMRVYLEAADRRQELSRQEPELDYAEGDSEGTAAGGSGTRAHGEEGEMGSPGATRSAARYRLQEDRPSLARASAIDEAARFGMIALLGAEDLDEAPHESKFDKDVRGAMGNMWGTSIDEAIGAGSLGLSGVGEGGGGSGAGIGLGAIGTVGHGAGALAGGLGYGESDAFGSCGDECSGVQLGQIGGIGRRGSGHHTTRTPSWRWESDDSSIAVNGRLPPEAVRRVVRQNFGRLRMCYADGLLRNPSLAGRVSVKFVIDHEGAVSVAMLESTDLADPSVADCVVKRYTQMSFPNPEGGIVTVVYPIVFTSEAG